jgi:hypothetical protein
MSLNNQGRAEYAEKNYIEESVSKMSGFPKVGIRPAIDGRRLERWIIRAPVTRLAAISVISIILKSGRKDKGLILSILKISSFWSLSYRVKLHYYLTA